VDVAHTALQTLGGSCPLEAVVSFVLGPLPALPPGCDLQRGYASDSLAFLAQALDAEGGGPAATAALQTLGTGKPWPSCHLLFSVAVLKMLKVSVHALL
jgi:hypothetical protein